MTRLFRMFSFPNLLKLVATLFQGSRHCRTDAKPCAWTAWTARSVWNQLELPMTLSGLDVQLGRIRPILRERLAEVPPLGKPKLPQVRCFVCFVFFAQGNTFI